MVTPLQRLVLGAAATTLVVGLALVYPTSTNPVPGTPADPTAAAPVALSPGSTARAAHVGGHHR